MQILFRDLDRSSRKIEKLDRDLQAYTNLTKAALRKKKRSQDLQDDASVSSYLASSKTPNLQRPAELVEFHDFSQAASGKTPNVPKTYFQDSVDKEHLLAAQSNLLPQLKFIKLDQIDFRSKYQRLMKTPTKNESSQDAMS